jgi:hypothetical protein
MISCKHVRAIMLAAIEKRQPTIYVQKYDLPKHHHQLIALDLATVLSRPNLDPEQFTSALLLIINMVDYYLYEPECDIFMTLNY